MEEVTWRTRERIKRPTITNIVVVLVGNWYRVRSWVTVASRWADCMDPCAMDLKSLIACRGWLASALLSFDIFCNLYLNDGKGVKSKNRIAETLFHAFCIYSNNSFFFNFAYFHGAWQALTTLPLSVDQTMSAAVFIIVLQQKVMILSLDRYHIKYYITRTTKKISNMR